VAVIGLVVLFGFSPAAQLAWASPLVFAHLLIFTLIVSCIFEYAAIGLSYWHDRRA